ncbi:MAG: PAS domain S-box protein [Gammaproteobacteria bacterium]|nr:PAS domain S-box protein [Gammaproteobacteria bacterium]
MRRLTEQTLLDHFDAACITIDPEGEIVYVHGNTRPFLDHIQGEPSLDLLRLVRKGLRPVLASAIAGARRSGEPIRHERVRVSQENGDRLCNVTLHAVLQPAALKGYLTVLLEDAGPVPEPVAAETAGDTGEYVATLERELRDTRGYLQATVEQLESTNEELTSANEELQSANEELQSTNEELQASQEELRSVNEELITVNTELETKVEALDQAHNDLSNLMASTELAILFLDTDLRVQRFTAATTRLLHLAEADIGRPIDHIAGELDYARLVEDAQALLDTLQSTEKEIRSRDGRWYLLRLRPYRTTGNVIRGVVLAFVDIHAQKRGEELKRLTEALEQSPVTVIITNREAEIQYVNPSFTEVTGYGADEVLGQNPRLLKSGEHPPDFYRELWDTISAGQVWRGRFCDRKKNGELFWESASISPVRDEAGRISHYVAVKEDITGRMHMEMALRASEARYREMVDNLNAGVVVYEATNDGENFLVRDMNSASERLSRLERGAVMDRPVTEVFPGVAELGLLAVLQRVWRSGVPEHLPAARYADPRLTQWVENYVYRLPTGEVVAIYEDVTERRAEAERQAVAEAALRRANTMLAVLGAWYRGMAQDDDDDDDDDGAARAAALCRLLVEQGGYPMAWVGIATDGDDHAVRPIARAGVAADDIGNGTFTWGDDPHGRGPTGTAIRSGRPVRMRAMDTDPTFAPWREAALVRGFKSSIALPLTFYKKVFGALTIYSAEVEAFSDEETDLLEELAASLAAAMRGHQAPEDARP